VKFVRSQKICGEKVTKIGTKMNSNGTKLSPNSKNMKKTLSDFQKKEERCPISKKLWRKHCPISKKLTKKCQISTRLWTNVPEIGTDFKKTLSDFRENDDFFFEKTKMKMTGNLTTSDEN